ncbi:MAG: hypothetical protein IPP10_18560 [Candidatus Competibacteraceae bacterium]|nr:hypothetical protein [Candidatus Competibacteraceae bacterium]MBK7984927.1 hypothetical protein [Candidatus Competibacteraceae bacterium]MBK8962665.1 hypothetical protein [Candidatus Competibacteraceae bacterium]MBK9953409.1 hypothetical protein [Candidatus Competibacteraceae bacterium]
MVFHAGQTVAEDDLKTFCREHLAGYKVPREIRSAAGLPLTGAGKLDRHVPPVGKAQLAQRGGHREQDDRAHHHPRGGEAQRWDELQADFHHRLLF